MSDDELIGFTYGFEAFPRPSGRAMKLWNACEQPERETDPWVCWHYRCIGCAVKAKATMMRYPDDAAVQRILGPLADAVRVPGDTDREADA